MMWSYYPPTTYQLGSTITLFPWLHKAIPTLRRVQQLEEADETDILLARSKELFKVFQKKKTQQNKQTNKQLIIPNYKHEV